MGAVRVISLSRHAQRRADFVGRNPHLPCSFFDAIDGRALTAEAIAATGLFTDEVRGTYDAHAYGCAMSHWHLWKEAASASGPLTICEDDAVFRRDFGQRSAALLATLPADWDVVLWGWNFDSVLQVEPLGQISPVVMLFDQQQLRESLPSFSSLETPVHALKLVRAFGLVAYTLSPRGAARFLQMCFPQRALSVFIPAFNRRIENVAIDVSTNAAYSSTNSFVCFPPLVATPNRHREGG